MNRPHRGTIVAAMVAALLLSSGAGAFAAEVGAELDGDASQVTVERGRTTSFTLNVSASGGLRCNATEENPAVATFTRDYTWTDAGTLTSTSATTGVDFWADGSCRVTWAGAPTPVPVTLTITATDLAPLGTYTFAPSVRTRTPFGSGDRLLDQTPTFVRLTVVPPAGDRTPPTVDCGSAEGQPGANGWWRSAVTVPCTASDSGSGLADPNDASFSLATAGEGTDRWTAGRVVTDREGNATSAGPFGAFRVDRSDPTIAFSHPSGATFPWRSDAAVTASCDDAVSGVDRCDVTGAVDTSVVGEHVVQVEARDVAGRTSQAQGRFRVVYETAGPWVAHPDKTHQPGRALPLSWDVTGTQDGSSFRGVWASPAGCDGGGAHGPVEAVATQGPVESDGGRHRVVIKTAKEWTGCMLLSVSLDDGTTHGLVLTFR